MAAVTVTANNTRVEDAEAINGWASIGGGAGGAAEGSFPYQGSNLYNRKVTSTTGAGFGYTPTGDGGSTHDMTSAAKTAWIAKLIVTDYGGLQATNGFRVRIGSSSSAYHVFIVAGSSAAIAALSEYPARGGLIIVPIDPNVSAYRDSTSGSPNLAAVDYFGTVAAFSASTAKAENVGCDAIDLGTGLTVVGGDGADPDATFQSFVSADQGTIGNRWGYAFNLLNGKAAFFGMLTIGTASACVFTDQDVNVTFPNGLFDAGYSGITVDLQNASTAVTWTRVSFDSNGGTSPVDTRAVMVVTSTSGALSAVSCSVNNFASVTATSASEFLSCNFNVCGPITGAGADFTGSNFNTPSGASALVWNVATNPDGLLDNTTFVSDGTGHAIEFGTSSPTTLDLSGITFSGYATTNGSTGNEAIWVRRTTGTVTINYSGTGEPSVRTDGATVNVVQNPVTVTVTLKGEDTGLALPDGRIHMVAAAGGSLSVGASIFNAQLCDAQGRVQTSLTLASDQPFNAIAAEATTPGLYVPKPFSGTISSASGLNIEISLVRDE